MNSIQLYSKNSVCARVPIQTTLNSEIYVNPYNINDEMYFSTVEYIIPDGFDIGSIPAKKTTAYCVENFEILPNLVCDFDSDKDKDKIPVREDLIKLTGAVTHFASNLTAAGFVMNKNFFVQFTGSAGYRFIIPTAVLGIKPYPKGEISRANLEMEHFARHLITKYSDQPDYLLAKLDSASFTTDRIMRAAYSLNKKSGLIAFPLDDDDIRNNISLNSVQEKSKAIQTGKIKRIDYSGLTLEINPGLNSFFNKTLTETPIKVKFTKPAAQLEPLTRSIYECGCMRYYLEHCGELAGKGHNRFETNYLWAILAHNVGGKEGLNAFHIQSAKKWRPDQDPEVTAIEWTNETQPSLISRPHTCRTKTNKEGSALLGILDKLHELFPDKPEAEKFRCNMGCPFYMKRLNKKPSEEELNNWALDYICEKKLLFYLQDFYFYDANKGYYPRTTEEEIKRDISAFLDVHFTPARLTLIKEKIRAEATISRLNTEEDELCINNGILNMNTFEVAPHTEEKIFFCRINVNYDPSKPAPESALLDSFLENLFPGPENKESLKLLIQYSGLALTRNTSFQMALIMMSDGNSGKTTYLNVLIGILGEDAAVALSSINDISNQKMTEMLKNKTLCYIDDMNSSELVSDGGLKSKISGGAVTFDTKYKKTDRFSCKAKFIFGTNTPGIASADFSKGFLRRFIIIKFPVDFDHPDHKHKKMTDIDKRILADQNAKDRLFYMAVEGYKKLKETGNFQISLEYLKRQYEDLQSHNIYYDFASNHLYYSPGHRLFRPDIYMFAQAYAKANGKQIACARKFFAEIARVAKCVITRDVANTLYYRSSGMEYLKNIMVKGIELGERDKLRYIYPGSSTVPKNPESLSTNDNWSQIKDYDVSITTMSYEEYLKTRKEKLEKATISTPPETDITEVIE